MYEVIVILNDGMGTYWSEQIATYDNVEQAEGRCFELQSMGYSAHIEMN